MRSAAGPGRHGARGRGLRVAGALTAVGCLLAGSVALAAPAGAATSPDPDVTITGRGFGHGVGMSQWGAYGAAVQGLTWQQIGAFYYPGTTPQDGYAGRAIRVQLAAMRGAPMAVRPATGLMVDTGGCTEVLPVAADTTQWRVSRSAAGWALERLSTSAAGWVAQASACPVQAAPTVTLRTTNHASTAEVTLVLPSGAAKAYRGWVTAVPYGATSLDTVNTVMLEHYLYSVVPSEMPAGWAAQALAAQAVAARTYAAARFGSGAAWDICDTTACQVYSGRAAEVAATTAAVDASSGVVLTWGGNPITAMFSASNGGQTAAANAPYLVSKPDPYEAAVPNPNASWRVRIAASRIESAWPGVGTFREMVVHRDGNGRWGGRATSIDLVGTGGTVVVTGSQFQSKFGLRSTYFSPEPVSVGTDLPGNAFSDVVGRDASAQTWLYPGNGRGGWLSRRLLDGNLSNAREVLAPGDLDGDGRDDVLVVTSDGYLELRPTAADGTLGAPRRIGRGWSTYSELTAPGDMTGDGFPDLVARDASGVLWIYRGDGLGGWLGRTKVSTGWGTLRELAAVGDFDGDGGTDITAVDSTGALRLYSFSATGTWTAVRKIGWGWGSFTRLTGPGDFDGDGAPDLLARDSAGGLFLYRGNGSGGWLGRVQVGRGWGSFRDIES
ncbi:MAG TPA: SpoIID/LytB domain-containing protein [Phycicoccus sp.]